MLLSICFVMFAGGVERTLIVPLLLGLVGIGVWALYDTFILNWLYTLLCNLVGNGYAYDIITGIPNVVIAALLIFAGLKLLGLHPEKKNRDDELPPYPHE